MPKRDALTEITDMFNRILGGRDDEITPETLFVRDNDIENIDVVKLVIACEKRFRVTIWDEDVLSFRCVEDVAAYVDELLAEGTDDLILRDDGQRDAWYYEY